MLGSRKHSLTKFVVKATVVAAAFLLAGLAFSSSAYAESNKTTDNAQASRQNATPEHEDVWFFSYVPVVYPWIPVSMTKAELRTMAELERDLAPTFHDIHMIEAAETNQASNPRVRLVEPPNRYVIRVSEPGIRTSDVSVNVHGRQVTVRYNKDQTIREAATSSEPGVVENVDTHFTETFDLAHSVRAGSTRLIHDGNVVNIVLMKS